MQLSIEIEKRDQEAVPAMNGNGHSPGTNQLGDFCIQIESLMANQIHSDTGDLRGDQLVVIYGTVGDVQPGFSHSS